ncbi:MAG: regulatory protein RecX [Elusimicrobia bacterium]|nr:regulatory protein RecX [Elusimicrobiota bacterium]
MEQIIAKAVRYCLYLLGQKNYTSQQLRDKLQRKKYPAAAITATLAKLSSWHYLDDDIFTETYVRGRLRFKPRGQQLILRELQLKGISKELAQAKIAKVMQAEKLDELGLAEKALRRKLSSYQQAPAEKGAQRARNYLLRQGFSYEITDKLVKCYWGEKANRRKAEIIRHKGRNKVQYETKY